MIDKTTRKPNNKSVGTKLGEVEYNKINDLVNAGMFISAADFVRQAIREKLERMVKRNEFEFEEESEE